MDRNSAAFLGRAKKDFSRMGWALFAMVSITTALQFAADSIIYLFPVLGDVPILRWLIAFLPLYLVGIPVGLIILKKLPPEKPEPVKLSVKQFFIFLLIFFPITYVGNFLGTFLSLILSRGNAENALMDYIMDSPVYTFVFAVLLAPVLEETIFRKVLLDRCVKYGEINAILFSALAFALFHMNLFQFFYAFGGGLILAYVYIRTRMVRYPIALHMIINFQGSVISSWMISMLNSQVLPVLESGTQDAALLAGILPQMLIYLVYNAGFMLATVAGLALLIIRWKKRVILPTEQEIPREKRFKTVYGNVGVLLFAGFCIIMTVIALFV